MTLLLLVSSQLSTGRETRALPATRARTYTQGSAVRLIVDIMDAETRTALTDTDLDDLVLTVLQPDGDSDTRTLSDQLIDVDPDIPGRFSAVIDTTATAGSWLYQFATVGDEAVVVKARFHVREALVAAP